MTPKEKAIELIIKMYSVYDMQNRKEFEIDEDDNIKNDELWGKNKELFESIYKAFAKDCALIAVEELNQYSCSIEGFDEINGMPFNTYWLKVKQEIEAL